MSTKDAKIKFQAYNLLIKGIEMVTNEDYDEAIKHIDEDYEFSDQSGSCICGVHNNNPVIMTHTLDGIVTKLQIGIVCVDRITEDIITNKQHDVKLCTFWKKVHADAIENEKKRLIKARSDKREKRCCKTCKKTSDESYFIRKGLCSYCREFKKKLELLEKRNKQHLEKMKQRYREPKTFDELANTVCTSPKHSGVKIKDLPFSYVNFCIKNNTNQAHDYKTYIEKLHIKKQNHTNTQVSKRVYAYGE